MCLPEVPTARGQGAPDVVWEEPTPNSLANSIQGVGWSPGVGNVAFGSTDRWLRTRRADDGALVYSVLQPHRSGGANQTIYSTDGAFLAVHNSSGGPGYRVHRAADGVFLGVLTVTSGDELVRFASDTTCSPPSAEMARSPAGTSKISPSRSAPVRSHQHDIQLLAGRPAQSAASGARSPSASAATARPSINGGSPQGSTSAAFTPDSTRLAA
jgi:hypothetical protein